MGAVAEAVAVEAVAAGATDFFGQAAATQGCVVARPASSTDPASIGNSRLSVQAKVTGPTFAGSRMHRDDHEMSALGPVTDRTVSIPIPLRLRRAAGCFTYPPSRHWEFAGTRSDVAGFRVATTLH